MTKFKSTTPVKVWHERGVDIINIEGMVEKINGNIVYLKVMFYDFSISKKEFETKNKFK